MKVLKKGCDNPNFGKDVVCVGYGLGKSGGCGALLHVVPRDVIVSSDGDGDSLYWIICPECNARTYVKSTLFK